MSDHDQQRLSGFVMGLTYAVGAGGIGLAFSTLFDPVPDLRWAALLAVGLAGILSFIRHSLLHRGDAARMGWDTGATNPFQIEVGLANLAWGVLAVVAVVFDWGLVAFSAAFLVFGFYMVAVTLFKLLLASRGARAEWGAAAAAGTFGVLLTIIGVVGMNAAT